VAAVALGAVAVTAYGGSDSATSSSKDSGTKAGDLSGKAQAGFEKFRDCMRAEGVEPSPNGPPAESEKTDKMKKAFAKCGDIIPSDVRKGGGEHGKQAGFEDFRDCMRAEGVEPSPNGPPAESEKTDKMKKAFAKCGDRIPSDIRDGGGTSSGGGTSYGGGPAASSSY
jgi:hypothetical protein